MPEPLPEELPSSFVGGRMFGSMKLGELDIKCALAHEHVMEVRVERHTRHYY